MRALNSLHGISSVTEIVNPVPTTKVESRRCLACRLPPDLREEIERDRIRGCATFAQLVKKLSSKGFNLSDSAVRRHFRHVPRDRYFEAATTDDGDPQDVATPFDPLVNAQVLDDRLVVEVMARSLVERLQRLERAQRATRNPAQAERLMTASLKEMHALERALRRREELAKPRQELVGKCKEFVGRVFQATKDACAAFIEDYLHMMDDAVNAHLADYSHPERLVRRMSEFQRDWPKAMRQRVSDAVRPIWQETMATLR